MNLDNVLSIVAPELLLSVLSLALLLLGAVGGRKATGLVSVLAALGLLAAAVMAAVGPLGSAFSGAFVADRFVVCTFVPRPIESDPGALKVPFYHSNDDYDEVIFYHTGDFFSRDNIKPGMMTFHPAGFTHGPHPKAFAAGAKAVRTMTDEVAVMIDARDALDMGEGALAQEDPSYADSWKAK